MEEGGGSSELECTNIDAAADSLDSSTIFHLVYDIVAFILFMHQQIPSVLQDITHEFDELRSEFKELEIELAEGEAKAISTRRKQAARKREVKMGIRRLEKLMGCISNLKTALQLVITEVPNIDKISLVLGPSPLRPLHIYELCFSNGRPVLEDFSRSKITEMLSRKAIRTMISKGVGSDSYAGPTKLFLLVKAPSFLNLPLHFLPKREFRPNRKGQGAGSCISVWPQVLFCNKKFRTMIIAKLIAKYDAANWSRNLLILCSLHLTEKAKPFRLRFRCRNQNLAINPQPDDRTSSVEVQHSTSKDLIWFQCRHTIKGIVCRASPPED